MTTIKVVIDNRPIILEVENLENAAEVYLLALIATNSDHAVTDQIVNAVQAADFETIG
jgi:hypothetical protein